MKNHFNFLKVTVSLALLIGLGASNAQAQCNGFTKQSEALLTPYDIAGAPRKVVLQAGDHAELSFTFFAGESYRIVMNTSNAAKGVAFILRDMNHKMIFSSATQPVDGYFDFISESTQSLIVEMIAADTKGTEVMASNCVSVIVGCKPQ